VVGSGEVLGCGGGGVRVRKGLLNFAWNQRIGVVCGLSELIVDTCMNAMMWLVLRIVHAFSPCLRFS